MNRYSTFYYEASQPEYNRYNLSSSGTIDELILDMQKRGYRCGSEPLTHERALYLNLRAERGFISYETIPTSELQSFCFQRGLPHKNGCCDRIELVRRLEEIDVLVGILLCSDLPPEIRVQVLELHLSTIRGQYIEPCEQYPPILYASPLTRREALPLFFARFRFEIHTPTYGCELCELTNRFIKTTPDEPLARIRFIRLAYLRACSFYDVNIIFESGRCRVELEDPSKSNERKSKRMERRLGAIVRKIAAREGSSKLRKSDIRVLHREADRVFDWY